MRNSNSNKNTTEQRKPKKKYFVLILPTTFPSYHSEYGQPTNFQNLVISGVKKQVMCLNYQLWLNRVMQVNKELAYISIRVWSGKPYHSEQIEIMQLHHVMYDLAVISEYGSIYKVSFVSNLRVTVNPYLFAKYEGLPNRNFRDLVFSRKRNSQESVCALVVYFDECPY